MLENPVDKLFNFLHFNSQEKTTLANIIRFVIYFFILLFLVIGLWAITKHYGPNTFAEGGVIENIQLALLLITSFIFLKESIQYKLYQPLLLFFASLTVFAFIREQDAFFETILPFISWKFAWFFPLLGAWNLFKKRKNLRKIIFSFLNSQAFQLMFMAMIVFIPLAQCIGHRPFIIDAMKSSENMITVRRLIEETMELVAYVLIFLSSIEMYKKKKKKEK